MRHTPGKWIEDGDDIGVEIIVGGEITFIPICTIHTPGLYNTSDKIAEGEANRALILAAPELFEACRGMERISDLWLPTETSIEHRDEAVALHSARVKILNAIAKAEGREL